MVRSIHEEIELNLVAAARGHAVAMGALQALPGEMDLCSGPGEHAVVKESYVRHSQNARNYVDGLVKSNECTTGEQFLDRYGGGGVLGELVKGCRINNLCFRKGFLGRLAK